MPMQNFKFSGTGVAVITPFKADNSIDYNVLVKQINFLIDNKVEYLLALGTTSEASTMNDNEKKEIVQLFIKTINKRVPLLVGMAGNNTAQIVNKIKSRSFEGIDGILSVSPYYNKPQQEGIYQHYKAIAEASPVPVILYNVPGRTASNISAETTLRLANDFENIVAIKEASGDFSQIMQIIKNKPTNFHVLSGDDALTLPSISVGVEGVISVIANSLPLEFSEMVRFALSGEFKKANTIHYKLLNMYNYIFAEGNPGGVKAAMMHQGLLKDNLRLPLTPVSDALKAKIKAELEVIKA